jgi:predicted P-loop ATPase/phage/plasmid primase-like uncharacterized protein
MADVSFGKDHKYPIAYWDEWSGKIIQHLNLKRTAKDEYHGPCPNCGGEDRFWIKQLNGEVKVNCRGCDDFKRIVEIMRGDGLLPARQSVSGTTTDALSDFDYVAPDDGPIVPYHVKKGVQIHNAVVESNNVVVTIISSKGKKVGTQTISPSGAKKFTKGMEKKGAFSVIGGRLDGKCYVAEGWATAASVHEATGRPVVFALDAGNLPVVVSLLSELRQSAEFVIAADNDKPGVNAAIAADMPYALPPEGQDWNDVHVKEGLDAVRLGLENEIQAGVDPRAAIRTVGGGEEIGDYVLDSKDNIIFCHHNAIEILTKRSEWKNVFAFDEFAQRKMVMEKIPGTPGNPNLFRPRELTDTDYISVIRWFNKNEFPRANKTTICDVVDAVCHESIVSPVKHWLDQMGDRAEANPKPSEYLDTWAEAMFGIHIIDDDHAAYVYEISRKWIIAAVARAMQPGCKADGVLILEGTQGAGKSTALRILAGDEWFGDALPQMGTKDASDYLRGKWIVELAELSNINKAEVEIVKAFVSRTEERFRPAYGRSEICYPRQCIFAGTTNKSDYLRDETGNRRFWPVKCGEINLDMIKRERETLWGEAVRAYRSGEQWWLSGHAETFARVEQQKRLSSDEWTSVVVNFCEGKNEVAISQILTSALMIEAKDINRQNQNRVSTILSSIGFTKSGVFFSGELRNKARFVREE